MPMSAKTAECPRCHAPVRGGVSEGLCPRCLLSGGFQWQDVLPPEDDEPAESLPRRFGEYELQERLAEGGMGIVYRARHTGLHRTVALKMIRSGHFAGAEELRRFRQEARAAAHLDHPNVVPVYEVGEHEGMHFFTMKLAVGGCLTVRGPMPPRDAGTLLAKVARAVHYAHQHGVLHRDLKPSNILMESGDEPVVSDFGLARLTQEGADITLQGSVLGTPAFMAPEQARGACTTASDIYSLGAVLYALLSGAPPFSGASHYEIMRRTVEEDPRPLGLPNSARDLEVICLKCLRKEPAGRYASAEALADDIMRWLRGEPIHARIISGWERLLKWARRRPAQAALVTVSLIGATGFLVMHFIGENRLRHERNYALQQEGHARESAALASASEQAARLQLYAADVFLAGNALANNDYGLARTALNAHIPKAGAADLRGFEWYCLRRRCLGDLAVELAGHTGAVTAVTFNKDGTRLLTGGLEGQAFVRDVSTGEVLISLPTAAERGRGWREHSTLSPVFFRSPDAMRLLVTGGESYDRLLAMMKASSLGNVRAAAFSPDGKEVATGSQWSWVRGWNGVNGKLSWVTPAFDCRSLSWAAGGTRFITGNQGNEGGHLSQVHLYDATTHAELMTIQDATGAFALSTDDSTLAVPLQNGMMEIRNPADGSLMTQWSAGTPVRTMAISANGQQLAGIGENPREAWLWTAGGVRTGPLTHDGAHIRAVALTHDGKMLATGSVDHTVRLWDTRSLTLLRTLRGHADEVLAVAFRPDGRLLATGCRDQLARLWDLRAPGQTDEEFPADHPVLLAGSVLIENSKDGNVRTGPADGSSRTALPGTTARTVLCTLTDDAGFVTLSREAPELEFWTLAGQSLRPAIRLDAPADIKCAAASSRSGIVAVAGAKKNVTLCRMDTGAQVRQLLRPGGISHLRISPDGEMLLEFTWPRLFSVSRIATGETLSRWQVPGAEVSVFTFSPDSRLVALGGTDNLVSIHNVLSGERVTVLRGHKADIKAAAFSPDGRTLATSADSRTLKLWHVPTWRELATLPTDAVFSFLSFSPENESLWAWDYLRSLHRISAPVKPAPPPESGQTRK